MYIYSPEFRLGSNALTASATVLVLDYLLTLDEEINYMWMQPKGFGTLLFFLNRYSPFLDTLMALYTQMGVVSPERCKTLYQGITWLVATGLCMSELILLLRTFAMWNHKKTIFFILATMSTLTWGPGIAITYLEIASFRFEPVPEGAVGCRLVSASKLIWVTFILLAFSETVICILTVMKGIHHLRSSSQTWVKHVYRHGLIFYFYLLAITITNMIVPLISTQPLYKNYLAVPQRVFHSIFCNRVILVISAQRSHRAYDSMELTRQHTITKNNMTGNIDTGVVHTDASHQQFDLNELRTVDRDGDGDGDGDGDDVGVRVETYSRDWTR